MFQRGRERVAALSQRSRDWVGRQDPGSATGVAIGAWRHYRAVDGPLQSALLSLYVLVAVLPAVLVMEEYLDPHPNSLANSIVHHFNLNAPTATLLHGVLNEGRSHELGSALLAIAGALIFGVGFGRVLQLVHTRAWNLPLPTRQTDQALYGLVLLGLYGLLLLLLVQVSELKGDPEWVGLSLAIGWVGLLVLFFLWAPWLLTRKLITRRDLLPSAVLTALGLVALINRLAICDAVLGRPVCPRLRWLRGHTRDLLLDRAQLRTHRLGRKPLSGPRGPARVPPEPELGNTTA
jgi:uncharacterized BrkB/YihY/UPF0761 family membrane protein